MDRQHERLVAHARALRAREHAMPPEGKPPALILDSWARCVDVGLDASAALRVEVADAADVARRREACEFVRGLARAELETLAQQIAGSNYLLAFADREGVILDLLSDNRFEMSGSGAVIAAGSRWAESLCGTNGLGTALATGQAVAVTGLEHYFLSLGDISCAAAPVRDASGTIVGALDASSYFESRQRHTQALVQMAATHIENRLFAHQMRTELVLAVHPRPEYLGTLSAGLLGFDGQGRLLAINARARSLLAGLQAAPGTGFEELFAEPFEHVLARLHSGHEVRLRDAMGSTLMGAVVSRPPVRRGVGTPAAPGRAMVAGGGTDRSAPPVMPPAPPDLARAGADAGFVCADPAVAEACALVRAAVRMGVPILIEGETGSGKEMLARLAHAESGRAGELVAVNCGALPAELVEAELFGYVGGAFTGARREGSGGLLAAADAGTLLLDEVGELPLALQAALLRFLDDRMVRPVGGSSARRVDVQVLAATNRDLQAEVDAGRFRKDLLYRLNTIPIDVPPLRERPEDIPALVEHFSRQVAARLGLALWQPDATTLARFMSRDWPGNLRELAQAVERMYVLGTCGAAPARARPTDTPAPPSPAPADQHPVLPLLDLIELRRLAVRQALATTNGHRGQAASLLNVSPNTMTKLIADACPEHKSPRGRRPR